MMRRFRSVAALVASVLALAGCSRYEPLSLHGSGSMRVEVEVYKGPLTKPLDGQVGELLAVLTESIYALDGWESQASNMLFAMTCHPDVEVNPKDGDRRDCAALTSAYYSAGDALGFACLLIKSDSVARYYGRNVWLPMGTCSRRSDRIAARSRRPIQPSNDNQSVGKCDPNEGACLKNVLVLAVNNLATIMRGSAFRASDANVRFVPRRREVRGLLTAFGFIAAEFGNQMQARVNVLQRQLPNATGETREARLLPMTEYLRDSGNTDFIQLFDWLNATADGGLGGFPRGKLDPQERIRMAQRLTSDYYWQKVNEVYTSGQGDVSMAFIKDDLGNWDLKSFSNDPSELLRSYRRVTDAALKTASRLARSAATGGVSDAAEQIGAAQQAAGLANQLATGEVDTPAPAGELGLPALRDRVSARLAAERARYSSRMTELENKIALENGKIDAAKDLKASLATQVAAGDAAAIAKSKDQDDIIQAATLEKLVLERRKADLPRDAMASVNQILDDHLATVAALQQSVAGPPPAAPPSP